MVEPKLSGVTLHRLEEFAPKPEDIMEAVKFEPRDAYPKGFAEYCEKGDEKEKQRR